jgi:hypothetical protein
MFLWEDYFLNSAFRNAVKFMWKVRLTVPNWLSICMMATAWVKVNYLFSRKLEAIMVARCSKPFLLGRGLTVSKSLSVYWKDMISMSSKWGEGYSAV